MPTIAELHRVAHRARNPQWQSELNCGPINTELRDAINDVYDPIADLAVGEFTRKPEHPFGAEHAFVYIPREHVAENTPVILDGALDQFSVEAHDAGRVPIGLYPEAEFPRVALIARNDQYTPAPFTGLWSRFKIHDREGPNDNGYT